MVGSKSRPLTAFLCHGSEDKPVVRELYSKLRMDGVNPWLDETDILPGQDWDMEIRQAVRYCDVILVCLSSSSVNKEGYVQKEIKFALDAADEKPEGAIFIIPVKLNDCDVPIRLKKWQWMEYSEKDAYSKLLLALRQRGKSLGLNPLPGDGPIERVGKPIEENSGRLLYKSIHLRELLRQEKEGKIDKIKIEPQPTNKIVGITSEALSEILSPYTNSERLRQEKELILELVGIREPFTYWLETNTKIHCFQNKGDEPGDIMAINRTPVSSSNIASIGYDEKRQILEVEFHNGSVYQYFDVPIDIYNGLMMASSHGKYLHQVIKSGGYAYRQIM